MIKIIILFYAVVAILSSLCIAFEIVEQPKTNLPCRVIGSEDPKELCRRW